jgi:hypothetical protein
MAKSTIDRRRAIRAAEHKRDSLLVKQEQNKADLAKARLELSRVKKTR